MGGGVSSEDKRSAMSEEAKRALAVFEGLSEEAKREITAFARTEILEEVPPAAVEISTPRATAPAVEEKEPEAAPPPDTKPAEPAADTKPTDPAPGRSPPTVGPHDRGLPRPEEHLRAAPTARRPQAPARRLLKWEWMETRADRLRSATTDEERRALALPRRQDLERDEPDAFYSAEEVRQLETNGMSLGVTQLSIVSVSHAWETSVHPDPRGANLLLLVDAIKRAQKTKRSERLEAKLLSSLAVFFDFALFFTRSDAV